MAVDETFVTKRKLEAGRRTVNMKQTLIGAAEVYANGGLTGRFSFRLIENRQKVSMVSFIKDFVDPHAVLFTDSHRSYRKLKEHGFQHRMVNHNKREFKSPEGATTNAIEGVWLGIKRLIRYQKS